METLTLLCFSFNNDNDDAMYDDDQVKQNDIDTIQ